VCNHRNVVQALLYLPALKSALPDRIVMRWAAGGNLSSYVHAVGAESLTPRVLVGLMRDIAAGLLHLHSKGIVHRDIKPENVLVQADGTALVADLGLSLSALSGGGGGGGEFGEGCTPAGTPGYMPPWRPDPCHATKADVWSLGCLLWQLACGRFDDTHPYGPLGVSFLARCREGRVPADRCSALRLPAHPGPGSEVRELLLDMLRPLPDRVPSLTEVEARLQLAASRLAASPDM
jgi:serine/threonine protein kinase